MSEIPKEPLRFEWSQNRRAKSPQGIADGIRAVTQEAALSIARKSYQSARERSTQSTIISQERDNSDAPVTFSPGNGEPISFAERSKTVLTPYIRFWD